MCKEKKKGGIVQIHLSVKKAIFIQPKVFKQNVSLLFRITIQVSESHQGNILKILNEII